MTEKPIQLGLAGLGTVGSGVYETLCRNLAPGFQKGMIAA